MTKFDRLFNPQSIAVIGASNIPGKIGYSIVDNLINGGYKGKIFPVNLKESHILGLKAYKSVLNIPLSEIDLAILAIPASYCIKTIEECGMKKTKFTVVISAGFAEVGNSELEEELIKKAKKNNMRILGPNVVGILSNPSNCNASFAPGLPYPGSIALISQSGVMVVAIDARSWTDNIGISYLISIGNMADIRVDELIEYLADDKDVGTIALYIEGLKDGRALMSAAQKCRIPVIALKAGVSSRGAIAANSHTSSMAGSSRVFDAAMKQCGVIRANSLSTLFSRSKALSFQPPLKENNILVLTNGGGAGVLTADLLDANNLALKAAPVELQELMKNYMPAFGSSQNPVDLTGMATTDIYRDVVKTALLNTWVSGLIVLYSVTATTDPLRIAEAITQGMQISEIKDKPVVTAFLGGQDCDRAIAYLLDKCVPAYNGIAMAVDAMAALFESTQLKKPEFLKFKPHKNVNRKIVQKEIIRIRNQERTVLTEVEAKKIIAAYGIPVISSILARDRDEAEVIANKLGYPVAMKIASMDILHKSDAGGVKLNIKSDLAVKKTFDLLIRNAISYNEKAVIEGVTIQKMAKQGTEIIIGAIQDKTFGPVVMFGMGGIFVEVLDDVIFRVAPINVEEARKMVEESRAYPLFRGIRGQRPRDIAAIANYISCISQLIYEFPEIGEIDINPVFIYQQNEGCIAVDARILLTENIN